jgi:hypothetical protein
MLLESFFFLLKLSVSDLGTQGTTHLITPKHHPSR